MSDFLIHEPHMVVADYRITPTIVNEEPHNSDFILMHRFFISKIDIALVPHQIPPIFFRWFVLHADPVRHSGKQLLDGIGGIGEQVGAFLIAV